MTKDMPGQVNSGEAQQKAKICSNLRNVRIGHDSALRKKIIASLKDSTELSRKYTGDQAFQTDLNDLVFKLTYRPGEQE
jgi:hypothetical protein